MSAYALADLRRRTGMSDVEAICAGRLPPRAKWVFEHFHLKGVRPKRDVYVRVMGESSREAQSGRRLLGTNGGSLWLWCCLAQPGALGP